MQRRKVTVVHHRIIVMVTRASLYLSSGTLQSRGGHPLHCSSPQHVERAAGSPLRTPLCLLTVCLTIHCIGSVWAVYIVIQTYQFFMILIFLYCAQIVYRASQRVRYQRHWFSDHSSCLQVSRLAHTHTYQLCSPDGRSLLISLLPLLPPPLPSSLPRQSEVLSSPTESLTNPRQDHCSTAWYVQYSWL